MLIKAAAITLAPMMLVGGVVMNSSIMLVDVTDDDTRIVVPVPLSLAQIAVAFAPSEAKYVQVPDEVRRIWPYVDRFVEEIRDIPDVMLVEVVDGNDHVQIFKEGDVLKILVDEGGKEHVEVNVPLASLAAMVDAYDADGGYFRTSRLVGALRAAPSGDLVRVVDGNEKVHIRMW